MGCDREVKLFLCERVSQLEGLTLLSCSWCKRSEDFCAPTTYLKLLQLLLVWCRRCWYNQPLCDQWKILCRLLSGKLWWETVECSTLWEAVRGLKWAETTQDSNICPCSVVHGPCEAWMEWKQSHLNRANRRIHLRWLSQSTSITQWQHSKCCHLMTTF